MRSKNTPALKKSRFLAKVNELLIRFDITRALKGKRMFFHWLWGRKRPTADKLLVRSRIEEARRKLKLIYELPESEELTQGTINREGLKEKEYEKGNEKREEGIEVRLPKEIAESDPEFKTLSEIAKVSKYKREYLGYLVRQGKLKAKKFGNTWKTTIDWVREFEAEAEKRKAEIKLELSEKLGGRKKIEERKDTRKDWKDILQRKYFEPAAALLGIVMLVVIANVSKADWGYWMDAAMERALAGYNLAIEKISKSSEKLDKSFAQSVHVLKIGIDKLDAIKNRISDREHIKKYEEETGLVIVGPEEGKRNFVDFENEARGMGIVAGEESSTRGMRGKVLAAVSEGNLAQNVGDVEVSAYILGSDSEEIPNGVYDVRFALYTVDRTESDPYPSDTDQTSRVWEETRKIEIKNGLLSAYLGQVNPLPTSLNFGSQIYYLGIRVGEDSELVPRKRIGAVPLSRVALDALSAQTLAGYTVGNAAGNVPLSNGVLNVTLNADLLDGMDSGDFQPAGSYDNYQSWKLQASSTDVGQKIKSNKGAVFVGMNGIATSRNLSTLTISPVYGSVSGTVAEGSTPIIVNTTGNLQGGGTGTAGGGINLTLDTVTNPTFATIYGTTLDLGTNTLTDGNFTGDWNFNAGALSGISALAVTGDVNLTTSTNLIFGGTTSLREYSSATDSGAYYVGVSTTGFANSGANNVQDVLADLDMAISGGGGGSLWSLSGGVAYLTNASNNLAVGGNTLTNSVFGVEVGTGNFYYGYNNSANPTFLFEATDGDAGTFGFNANDNFYITGANLGIGTNNAAQTLDVRGSLGVGASGTEFIVTSGGNVTGGAYNGITIASGTGTLTLNSYTLTLSGSSQLNQNLLTTSSPTFQGLTLSALSLGTADSVIIESSGTLQKRTIDSRVWGSILVDGSGTANYVAYWQDANTLTSEQYLSVTRGGTGTGSLTGVLKGNGTSAFTAMTGTQNYLTRWTDANTLGIGSIYDNGTNVGIGTTAVDTYKLNVNGTINATGYYANGTAGASATTGGLTFTNGLYTSGTLPTGLPSNGTLTGQTLYWNGSAWTASSVLFNNNANVGIGTTNPTQLFSVANNFTVNSSGVVTSGIWNGTDIDISDYTNLSTSGTLLQLTGDTLSVKEGTLTNGYICTYVSGTGLVCNTDPGAVGVSYWNLNGNDIYNNNSGNVGIGTTNPQAKLEVAGGILASTINGNTISSGTGTLTLNSYTLTLSGSSQLNQNLLTTSSPTFQGLTLSALSSGTTDSVLIESSGALQKRTIDSRVWGSSLVDGSGTANYAAYWSDANTLTAEQYLSVTRGGTGTGTLTGVLKGNGTGAFTAMTGTQNYLTKWQDANTLTTSVIYDNGTNVGIGTTSPAQKLEVTGAGYFSSGVYIGTNSTDYLIDDASNGSGSATLYIGNRAIATTGSGGSIYGTTNYISKFTSSTALGDSIIYDDGTNVGIGTTASLAKLTVAGNIFPSANDTYDLGSDTYRWDELFLGPSTLHLGTSTSDEYTISYDTTNNRLGFNVNGSGNPEIVFDANGNVGIGTTEPTSKLTVNGNISIAASGYLNFGSTDGDSGYGLRDNGGTLQYKNSGGSWTNITSLPSGLTGQTLYYTGGAWMASSLLYNSGTNIGIGTTNPQYKLEVAGEVSLGSGAEVMRISSSGNVGIGTTNPTRKLEVAGVISTGGNYVMQTYGGTSAPTRTDNGDFGFAYVSSTYRMYLRLNGSDRYVNLTTNAGDVSEFYDNAERVAFEIGDVVCISESNSKAVERCDSPSDPNVLGIVSEEGTKLNDNEEGKAGRPDLYVNVGILGQLLTKVSTENGNIRRGDYLTSSSRRGVAKKATQPGKIIGRALENYSNSDPNQVGLITVAVSAFWWDGNVFGESLFANSANGNLGIGIENPSSKLQVNGSITPVVSGQNIGTENLRWDIFSREVKISERAYMPGLSTGAGDYALRINSSTGEILRDSSSRRYKHDIVTYSTDLDKLSQLRPVSFRWNANTATPNKVDFGLIAEEVNQIYPELVIRDKYGNVDGVRYEKLGVLLLGGFQQQQAMIKNQERIINNQQSQIADYGLQITDQAKDLSSLQTAINDKLNVISSGFFGLDSRLTVNESKIQDLKSQLTAAETKLLESERNLSTFQSVTNDTLTAMLETENMLTERVLNHEDRIKALEDKLATLSVQSGGALPANVVTQDARGNVLLAGIFEAKSVKAEEVETKGIVAGSVSVKNSADAPTVGEGEIVSVKTDANGDGWDDVTAVDGKSARVTTAAVTESAKIFVTLEGDPGSRWWVEKIRDPATGKLTSQFSVNVAEPVTADIKFSWFIVESK